VSAENTLSGLVLQAAKRYGDIALGLVEADTSQRQALEKILKRAGLLAEEGAESTSVYEAMPSNDLIERLNKASITVIGNSAAFKLPIYNAESVSNGGRVTTPFFLPWLDPAGTAD
jgi:hypothetical protein